MALHIEHLVRLDDRLIAVFERAGPVATRFTEPGFAALVRIVCGQLLSVASATAIWNRYTALPGALTPEGFLALDAATVRGAGFSNSKYLTVEALAHALIDGRLDLAHIDTLTADAAVAEMTTHRGIGPWTAEIYLMICAAHPDVFPAGDIALRKAVAHGLGLPEVPSVKALYAIAERWAPHRGSAALLFWRYYATMTRREGILL